MKITTRQLTQAAAIAAAYIVVTIAFAPISYGLVQFRISESLMLLAAITPAAIPGLFIGCVIANLYGGFGIMDIVFGSTATLLAAFLTNLIAREITKNINDKERKVSFKTLKMLILPLPTIIINGVIVGGYLPTIIPEIRNLSENFLVVLAISIGSVILGELVVTYALGIPLYVGVNKTRIFRSYDGL